MKSMASTAISFGRWRSVPVLLLLISSSSTITRFQRNNRSLLNSFNTFKSTKRDPIDPTNNRSDSKVNRHEPSHQAQHKGNQIAFKTKQKPPRPDRQPRGARHRRLELTSHLATEPTSISGD
ncbi:putative transcriptional regulator [Corchorus capsularis]|uniref:Putative transcriptional regulator n=1 Tax=Corchorus capsularis TaxID=210143 RepID=A0A1R3IMN2_COCAP|nr:putative transcriptional regulator [Corchorus capsularis]